MGLCHVCCSCHVCTNVGWFLTRFYVHGVFYVCVTGLLQMPLHTVIEIQMGVSGVQEKRYRLMDTSSLRSMLQSDKSLNSSSYP